MNKSIIGYFLLLFQPLFMASNLIVARGGVDDVPPISLSFWRWFIFFLILFILNFKYLTKNFQIIRKESKRSFFLGLMGCGVCGIFPYMAGSSTTIVNMGILYTSSPIFIILISFFLFKDKIILADEFTPDGCRLWDTKTLKKMDKDRFRQGLGDVVESYHQVADRLGMNIET